MKKLIVFLLLSLPSILFSSEENFLVLNNITNEIVFELGSHVNERISPCSSFKIALSLMGYDAQILKDKENPTWAFQEGYLDYFDSWTRPQNPQSWIKNSCVWYSQCLTTELGIEKVQNYLKLLEYGNQDMSAGLTTAWLSSSLKISIKEQVYFLYKMLRNELPISNHAIEMTKSLLLVDELQGDWKLFGKTGSGNEADLEIGWFIGWIEKDGNSYSFAYHIRDENENRSQRIPRVKQLLFQLFKNSTVLSDTNLDLKPSETQWKNF